MDFTIPKETYESFDEAKKQAMKKLGGIASILSSPRSTPPIGPPQNLSTPSGRIIRAYKYSDPNDPLSYENQVTELDKHANILAWRPDVKNPKKLETLPIGWNEDEHKVIRNDADEFAYLARRHRSEALNLDQLRSHAEALRDAKSMGVKYPDEITSPQFLAALALREGRGDYGTNINQLYSARRRGGRLFSKKGEEIFNKLIKNGTEESPALFAALMYDKTQDAERLNKPFTALWNGTGTFVDRKTHKIGGGDYYAKTFNLYEKAALHPKNSSLLNFIKGSLTPISNHKTGGSVENTTHYRKMI